MRVMTGDGRRVKEHIFIAERAIGHPLPRRAEVHHINKDRADNRPGNLVVCPNHAYHALLHVRADAYDACGNANWRKCRYCKVYESIDRLTTYRDGQSSVYWHKECANSNKHRRTRANT
jgi:hypothetical protein